MRQDWEIKLFETYSRRYENYIRMAKEWAEKGDYEAAARCQIIADAYRTIAYEFQPKD